MKTREPTTARALRKLIAERKVSAVEATREVFAKIARLDERLRAFVTLDEEGALASARSIDERLARGEYPGALAGIPVALKDNLCTHGLRTTCCSRMLQNYVPPYDSTVVERLRAAGTVIIGKTNMDEFAMGSSTENSAVAATRNPWDLERVPGGSSGGSAAAVAAGFVPLALGSDTGGSIRQPAALCGVTGLKPTYGRVSRYGLVAFASSLDQIGPFARDAADCAMAMNVIAGHDPLDSTSAAVPPADYERSLQDAVRPLRIGVPPEYFAEGLDGEVGSIVREAIVLYGRLGAQIVEVSMPHSKYAIAAYYIIATAEASSNLARYDGVHYGYRSKAAGNLIDLFCRTRQEGFGEEVKRRVLLGTFALSSGYYDAYYLKAARVRSLIRQDFDRAFEKVDVLACPTTPTAAFRLGERTTDPLQMYLSDIYTTPANLSGVAAISIPCGFTRSGLPVGLQLMANRFEEQTLLRAAHQYQRETDFHLRLPPLAHSDAVSVSLSAG